MGGKNWNIPHPLKTFYLGNKKPMGGGSDPPRRSLSTLLNITIIKNFIIVLNISISLIVIIKFISNRDPSLELLNKIWESRSYNIHISISHNYGVERSTTNPGAG